MILKSSKLGNGNMTYEQIVKSDQIYPRWRLEYLDEYDNGIGIVDGADIQSVSVSDNYNQGVRRACNILLSDIDGEFVPRQTGKIWINRKFKLYAGLEYTNFLTSKKEIYWIPYGVYYVSNPVSSRERSSKTTQLQGVDKFGFLSGDLGYSVLGSTYLIKQGTTASQAFRDILMLDNGNGYSLDYTIPNLSQKLNAELPFDIKKNPEQYLGNILTDIANVFGCDISYDETGRLTVSDGTTEDISYSEQAPIWSFNEIQSEYLSSTLSPDFTNAFNSITVIGTNIKTPIQNYTAENRNPKSPTSIDKIGIKAMPPITSSTISTLEQASDYARYVLKRMSIVANSFDFSCTFLPHLQTNKVIEITDSYFKFDRERFIIQNISNSDSMGMMQIKCANLASLPYYEWSQTQ